uniref:RNA-binding protein 42 n=1 Tax=Globodera pallida TaxID=36090 RepID=A0A183BTJ7_GLOPA
MMNNVRIEREDIGMDLTEIGKGAGELESLTHTAKSPKRFSCCSIAHVKKERFRRQVFDSDLLQLMFEKEVLSVDDRNKSRETSENKKSKDGGPIQEFNIGGSSCSGQPATTTKFVPHQLRVGQPQPHTFANSIVRPPMPMMLPPATSSVVIESGPTLYLNFDTATTIFQNADVELLAAKKQATKAHENSYLGAVLRGEKKMKRFVRSCGGQVWEDASMAEWDPNDFRIFCGDLGNEVSDELLAKAFRKYPSFQKAKVVRDSRTNKSKGFGFVSFKHQDDFIRAMKEMDGKYVGNRPIKLRKSNWKERNLDIVKKKNKAKKKLGLL